MTDMALTKAEKSKDSMLCCGPEGERKTPNYPWALKMYLDKEALDKLGITAKPEVGALYTLTAQAIVEGSSENARAEDDGTNTSISVTLQITDMTAEPAGTSSKPASEVLYG